MAQAQAAEGSLSVEARRIAGVYYTVSLWRDRAAMLVYMRQGAHLKAMEAFSRIATGQVAGFTAVQAPGWTDVPGLLRDKGRIVA
jgi:quinol monooxygenase YgiN